LQKIKKMKQKTEENKGGIYTGFKDILKKIWNDSVGSNLISMLLKELLKWLFSLIINLFS